MAHMAQYDVVEEEIIEDDGDELQEITYDEYLQLSRSQQTVIAEPQQSQEQPWAVTRRAIVVAEQNRAKKLNAIIESVASTATVSAIPSVKPRKGSSLEQQVAKGIRRRAATVAQCHYCGVVIKHPSKIAAHMRTHTGEKPFECGICGMRFTQRTPMRMHVRRHVGDAQFECEWGCGKRFVSNALRNAHQLHQHMGEKRQGPPRPHLKPPKRTIPMTELEPEDERSPIVQWQPPLGELSQAMSVTASRRLDQVVDAVAAGVPLPPPRSSRRRPAVVAQCQECGIILKHPSKITAHMRTHTGEKPFECGVCNMRFAMANPLRIHLRRAHTGEKPFECTWECGKRFVSNAARNEHERIVHAGVKRYQCTVGGCRRLFTRRRYLMMHQRKVHEDADRRAEDAINAVLEAVEAEMPLTSSSRHSISRRLRPLHPKAKMALPPSALTNSKLTGKVVIFQHDADIPEIDEQEEQEMDERAMLEDAMMEDETQGLLRHEVDGEVEVDVDGEYVVPVGQGGEVAEYFQFVHDDVEEQHKVDHPY